MLAAFDALGALFADDLAGEADYVVVEADVTVRALKAVRDAIAAAYARPVLTRSEHAALLRPWRAVFPQSTVDEPDLGPRADAGQGAAVGAAAAVRPLPRRGRPGAVRRAGRPVVRRRGRPRRGRRATAFQAAVLTSRRRVWALIRRTGTEGLLRPCTHLPRPRSTRDREDQRVLDLCLDAACALLVADALPDACTGLLADPVLALIPQQRLPDLPS